MLASGRDSDLSDLEPLDDLSDDSRGHRSKSKKKVSFYDPEPDALALAAALKHHTPDPKPVIKILPRLSDDHVLMLRTEYKKHMKAQGKGVNIAKHIKMKMTGNLGKVAYAVALGRWESEAHWANFWYQSNTSRRELLIESLMGRSNSEIVKIKDAFSDQRYNNSLEKCMETELKKDKFRNAILLALEERRMLESEKLSIDLVRRDAEHLHRALTAKEGGETAMIDIIVVRSDRHLAEVLRVFESQYRKNFAREMIQRSKNLVVRSPFHRPVSLYPIPILILTPCPINREKPSRTSSTASSTVRCAMRSSYTKHFPRPQKIVPISSSADWCDSTGSPGTSRRSKWRTRASTARGWKTISKTGPREISQTFAAHFAGLIPEREFGSREDLGIGEPACE